MGLCDQSGALGRDRIHHFTGLNQLRDLTIIDIDGVRDRSDRLIGSHSDPINRSGHPRRSLEMMRAPFFKCQRPAASAWVGDENRAEHRTLAEHMNMPERRGQQGAKLVTGQFVHMIAISAAASRRKDVAIG